MLQIFTTYIRLLLLFTFGCLLGGTARAQYTQTIMETGGYYSAVACDNNDNVYVVRYNGTTCEIAKYTNGTGTPTVIYDQLANGPGRLPWGIAVNDAGVVFVTNPNPSNNWEIIKLTPGAGGTYTPQMIQSGAWFSALGMRSDNTLMAIEYVFAPDRHRLRAWPQGQEDQLGTWLTLPITVHPGATTTWPWGVIADAANNYYVLDLHENNNGQIIRMNAASGYTTSTVVASGEFFSAIAIDGDGNFYTTEYNGTDYRVVKRANITQPTGDVLLSGMSIDGLAVPWGLAVNSKGEVFVGDGSSSTGGRLVKLSPPGIAVTGSTRAGTNPSNAATVHFTVTFSGAATNVTSSAFSLFTAGGITAASIASVTGIGNTYAVTVNTGSGDGTLRLDVTGNGMSNIVTNVPYALGETYTIDKTAPTGTLSVNSGAAATNDPDVTLAITADGTAPNYTTSFSNDNVTWSAYAPLAASTPWTLSAGDGTKTVYMRLKDAAGNVTPLQDQILLDETVPATTITSAPPAITNSTTATFVFTSSEPPGTFEAQLDGSAFTPATSPLTFTGLAEGAHTFSARAIDAAGNIDATPAIHNWTIDLTAPAVANVSVPANGYYKSGNALSFTVQYNENVTVTGTPYLDLILGSATVQAAYVSGSGTNAHIFSYTVQNGDMDMNGITLGTNIVLNGGTMKDGAGNDLQPALQNVSPTNNVFVNTASPTVTLSTAAAAVNQQFTITVTFSEAVTGLTAGDFTSINTTLSNLQTTDNITYTALAIPAVPGMLSFSVSANAAQNIGGNGNQASNTLTVMYDDTAPAVSSVNVPANGTYAAGDALTFTVNYNEGVSVTGTPSLPVTIGAATVQALYTGGSGTAALAFSYTVQNGETDADGITAGTQLQLNGGTLRDEAGNNAATALTGIQPTTGVFVDAVTPVVNAVNVPANGYYKVNDVLVFKVIFSETVQITGFPHLSVTIGSTTRQLTRTGGSMNSEFTFGYTVQNGDLDMDGITIGSNLELNGGTIQDMAGNNAVLTLNNVGNTSQVFVNTVAPTVVLSGTPSINAPFTLTATFSEAVTGLAAADFTVTNATLSNLLTSDNITYTVLVTPVAEGAVSINLPANVAVNIGHNGNQASNVISYTYDGTAPAVTSVDVPANGYYGTGQHLDLTVHFSENVTVNTTGGTPGIGITIGAAAVTAAYTGGTGTNALTFRYTVQNGDLDMDGITINSLLLNSATIQDAAGNNAALALNNAGNTSGVFVNTQRPTVTLTASSTGRVNTPVTVTLTFSEAVSSLAATDITVTNGAASGLQTTDNITYTAEITPAADGAVSVTLPANVAENIAGNGNDASNTVSFTYDATAPVINAGQSFTVDQYSPAGTEIGQVAATAGTDALQNWAVATDGSGGALELTGTGMLRVKDVNLLGPLGGTTVTLGITVSDGLNTSAPVPVTVQVRLVNQAPTLDPVANVSRCADTETHTVQLTGASAAEPAQTYTITAVASQNVFDLLTVNTANVLSYQLKAGTAPGNVTVTLTIKDDGGTANGGTDTLRRSFTITVTSPPAISITSDKGASVSKGDVVRLTASGGSTYQWADAPGIISGQQSAVLEIRPQANTTYEVTGANAAGCTAAASISIAVVNDFKVDATNILTPNGDGRNDRWVVRNLDSYPNNEVKIFDRSGRLVYQRRNYSNEWDGTVNGSPLAEGTYYYILTINGGEASAKGYITIVRDSQ
ncbi:Ig-like domain-containing protein [Chitinophaga alhagiae]|uniref:Ig-like domain-containing protein n=1 Tax=Chitinophaga alhagiae TaxID=2203219 RepID=UPI000E5C0219|nr:Ig-like domain-containing protein [Chitinophaga alhagiae]